MAILFPGYCAASFGAKGFWCKMRLCFAKAVPCWACYLEAAPIGCTKLPCLPFPCDIWGDWDEIESKKVVGPLAKLLSSSRSTRGALGNVVSETLLWRGQLLLQSIWHRLEWLVVPFQHNFFWTLQTLRGVFCWAAPSRRTKNIQVEPWKGVTYRFSYGGVRERFHLVFGCPQGRLFGILD